MILQKIWFLSLYIATALIALPNYSSAQELDNAICSNARAYISNKFEDTSSANFIYSVPHLEFEAAKAIGLEFDEYEGRLHPFSGFSPQGQPVVFVPEDFVELFCGIVVAQWLVIGGHIGSDGMFDESLDSYFACLSNRTVEYLCEAEFSRDLWNFSQGSLDLLDDAEKRSIQATVNTGLLMILMHEVFHHLNNHFENFGRGIITRDLAEIDADISALEFTAIHGGGTLGVRHYYLTMAILDRAASREVTTFYRGATCRADLFEAFALVGLFTEALRRTLDDGTDPSKIATLLTEVDSRLFPEVSTSCSTGYPLEQAAGEIRQLANWASQSASMLTASPEIGNMAVVNGDILSIQRSVLDLEKVVEGMSIFDGFGAYLYAQLLSRAYQTDTAFVSLVQVERAFQQFEDVLDSRSYARLLNTQAGLLQNSTRTSGLTDARTAILNALKLLPESADSWLRLGLIEFQLGHCDDAIAAFETAYDKVNRVDEEATDLPIIIAAIERRCG